MFGGRCVGQRADFGLNGTLICNPQAACAAGTGEFGAMGNGAAAGAGVRRGPDPTLVTRPPRASLSSRTGIIQNQNRNKNILFDTLKRRAACGKYQPWVPQKHFGAVCSCFGISKTLLFVVSDIPFDGRLGIRADGASWGGLDGVWADIAEEQPIPGGEVPCEGVE